MIHSRSHYIFIRKKYICLLYLSIFAARKSKFATIFYTTTTLSNYHTFDTKLYMNNYIISYRTRIAKNNIEMSINPRALLLTSISNLIYKYTIIFYVKFYVTGGVRNMVKYKCMFCVKFGGYHLSTWTA